MRLLWIPALIVAALVAALLDRDAGILPWLRLRDDVAAKEARVEALRGRIADLEAQARALESDPFAQERAIREELEWARPGDTVVRLGPDAPPGDETPRFP